jgi:predicted RNase H-like nuclease
MKRILSLILALSMQIPAMAAFTPVPNEPPTGTHGGGTR